MMDNIHFDILRCCQQESMDIILKCRQQKIPPDGTLMVILFIDNINNF